MFVLNPTFNNTWGLVGRARFIHGLSHVGGRECDGGRVEGEHGATEKPTFGSHGFMCEGFDLAGGCLGSFGPAGGPPLRWTSLWDLDWRRCRRSALYAGRSGQSKL